MFGARGHGSLQERATQSRADGRTYCLPLTLASRPTPCLTPRQRSTDGPRQAPRYSATRTPASASPRVADMHPAWPQQRYCDPRSASRHASARLMAPARPLDTRQPERQPLPRPGWQTCTLPGPDSGIAIRALPHATPALGRRSPAGPPAHLADGGCVHCAPPTCKKVARHSC